MAEPREQKYSAAENLGKPLDPSATSALQGLASDLRNALLVEANRDSSANRLTDDDLYRAYKLRPLSRKPCAKTRFSSGFPTEWP
jgi:hypothetical protein